VVLTSFEDEVGQDRQRLGNTWVDLVTQRFTPQPTVIDLSRPGLTLSNARETAHSAALAKPAAVLLWLIIAVFKNSPTLANYETTLDQLLTFLDDAGCRTVVAGAPSAATLTAFGHLPAGNGDDPLPYWNAATARITVARNGRYVDLAELSESDFARARDSNTKLDISQAGHNHLAELFGPTIKWALSSEVAAGETVELEAGYLDPSESPPAWSATNGEESK
jgi:hypothetical protein